MKQVSLSGSARQNVGKKDAKALRDSEQVPCVLYGGSDQIHFSLKKNDAKGLVFTPDVFQAELDIEGKKAKAIVKDVQLHPVTDEILHMDFMEIIDGKPVRVKLPVRLEGSSRGVMAGGKLSQLYRRLSVVGMQENLPEAITINIEPLRIGDKVRVSDINIEGCKLIDAETAVVVAVRAARGAKVGDDAGDEEEGAEEAAAE